MVDDVDNLLLKLKEEPEDRSREGMATEHKLGDSQKEHQENEPIKKVGRCRKGSCKFCTGIVSEPKAED